MYKKYTQFFLRVMKITTVILFLALMQVSAAGIAQRLTLPKEQISLKQLFNEVNKQTDYTVVWSATQVNGEQKVSVDFKNTPLLEVLDQTLQNTNLSYSIENKTVVIKQKETSFLENLKNKIKAELNQTTVTGKVVDGTGQPIPGVDVKEKGTQSGTVTDSKGRYTLTVASDKSIVTFSYVGYETQELAAKDLPDGSTITLKAQENNLQEVVINKGYYYEKRELSTGDLSVVDAKTIEQQPVSDPIQALIGQVAGLNIQQTSGIPGAYAKINIRGLNSIAGGNDPFYVIDGVPFSSITLTDPQIGGGALSNVNGSPAQVSGQSPFNALNPDDIESIEVLKDADATAIYGSRGANGVILITTKKGKAGETKVSVDLSQGIGQVGHFMDMLNTRQYLQVMHKAFANDGIPFPSIATNPNDNYYDVDGVWDTTRYTNWQKVLIGNTAHYTNAQASISGGNANTQFLIGGGYYNSSTVFPGDYGDQKGSLHFSLTNTSTNQRFKVVLTASYINENNDVPEIDPTQGIELAPDAPALYNPNGSLNWQILNGTATFGNPLSSTVISYSSVTNNLVSNLNLSYRLLPGLILSGSFGYNHDEMGQTDISPATSNPPPNNNNPDDRYLTLSNNFTSGWIVEPQLSYQKKVDKGQLDALIGGTLQQSTSQHFANFYNGFSSDALIDDPAAATNGQLADNQYSLYRYEALVARIGYTWDDKYLLNLTGNRDGSSRFGPGKQYGNFGALGAGWIFSKEKVVEDAVPWLSFGKLRASYGTTGNDQIGNYQYLSTYSSSSTSYQGVTELNPKGLANSNYSWEVDKKLEGGLDMGFLKDQIDFSLNYYRNRTGNQLVGYPLPSLAGFTSVQYNLPAVVQNTGLEATLHTVNIKSKDFNWTTSVNFTLPNNKLISYPGIAGSGYAYLYTVGESLFTLKRYQYEGVNPQTGYYNFVSTSGDPGNPNYPTDVRTTQPLTQKYYGGVVNDFTYNDFGFEVFVQFVKQLGQNYLYYYGGPPGSYNTNFPTAVLGAWQNPGNISQIERYSTQGPSQFYNYQFSNGVITDASFIRIKNVELYYKFPTTWQNWAHMQNARIYLQGQNLYTFTKYIGLDPETEGLGLPPLRVIMLGISASF